MQLVMAAVRTGSYCSEKEAILLPVTGCQGAIRESRKMQLWGHLGSTYDRGPGWVPDQNRRLEGGPGKSCKLSPDGPDTQVGLT